MLLSLMLVSGSIALAQEPEPATIYVSFADNAAINMTYGDDLNTVIANAGLDLNSLTFQLKKENETEPLTEGEVSFKEGVTLADVLSFSKTPTAMGNCNLTLNKSLANCFSYTLDDATFIANGTVQRKLNVAKAPLTLSLPDSSRLYDEQNISMIPVNKIVGNGLKNDEKLDALLHNSITLFVQTNAGDGVKGPKKSDVGIYDYQLTSYVQNRISGALGNYAVTFVDGKYEVKKDTITIKVFQANQEVSGVKVMQKVYGEPNPDGYFKLKKRIGAESGSYSFSNAAAAKNFISAANEADAGFKVAPVAGYYDYEGRKATESTDVNLKRKEPNQGEDSLYVATVDNIKSVSSLNYAFKVEDGSFLITPRPLEIWKVVVNRVYGEANRDTVWTFEPNDAAKKSGLTSFDMKYQTTATPGKFIDFMPKVVIKQVAADNTLHAGIYTDTMQIKVLTVDKSVSPEYSAQDRNYTLDMSTLTPGTSKNDSVSLVVAKAPLTIHLDTIKRPYGSDDPDFNNAETQKEFIHYTGFKLDESANSLDSTATVPGGNRIKTLAILNRPSGLLPVGTYELTGRTEYNEENTNYEITITGKACYQIYPDDSYVMDWEPLQTDMIVGDKFKLTAKVKHGSDVVAEGAQIIYESSNPELVRIEKVENIWYVYAKELTGDAGVTITARYNAESGYKEAVKSVVYKVLPLENEAHFNIILGNMIFDYDGTPKAAEVELTDLKGLATDYVPVVIYDSDPDLPVNAGLYNISIFAKRGESQILVRKEKLQIKPREVYVTPDDKQIVYGETVPTSFSYTYTGFLNGADFKASSAPVVKVSGNITGAGNYTLYVEGGDPGSNYTMVGKTGTLTISKAPLTIKADTVTIVYGDAVPELKPTFEGFVGNDNPEKLNFIYTVEPSATPENAGKYNLNIKSLSTEETNYDVKLVPGELIVEKADANLQYDVETTSILVGDSVLVYVTCDSPAKVAYSTADPLIAGYREHPAGVHVIGKAEGVTKLYFNVPESTNYLSSRDSLIFNVKQGEVVANESISLQGVGLYPTFVENSATVVADTPVAAIYVIDAAGKVQKAIKAPQEVIDLSQLSSGYYLVRIELTNGQIKTVRIVKK